MYLFDLGSERVNAIFIVDVVSFIVESSARRCDYLVFMDCHQLDPVSWKVYIYPIINKATCCITVR